MKNKEFRTTKSSIGIVGTDEGAVKAIKVLTRMDNICLLLLKDCALVGIESNSKKLISIV